MHESDVLLPDPLEEKDALGLMGNLFVKQGTPSNIIP